MVQVLLWTVMTHPTLIVEENDAGGITMGYKDTTDDDDAYYSGYTVGIWSLTLTHSPTPSLTDSLMVSPCSGNSLACTLSQLLAYSLIKSCLHIYSLTHSLLYLLFYSGAFVYRL